MENHSFFGGLRGKISSSSIPPRDSLCFRGNKEGDLLLFSVPGRDLLLFRAPEGESLLFSEPGRKFLIWRVTNEGDSLLLLRMVDEDPFPGTGVRDLRLFFVPERHSLHFR